MKSIIVVFIVTVLFLVGMTKFTNDTNYNEALRYHELSQYYNYIERETEISEDDEILFETIEIDVTFLGAVKKEKTVSVKAGSYLSTAIEEVGGLTDDADTRCVNGSYVILEPMEFYIPSGKDLDKVSINSSTEVELMSLPSVGGTIAKRIVEYRNLNGNYGCLEDLLNVKGVGKITFDKFKDYIIL